MNCSRFADIGLETPDVPLRHVYLGDTCRSVLSSILADSVARFEGPCRAAVNGKVCFCMLQRQD